jgi:pimeloyl-ACP methyl ester carboxylesterase
VRCSTRATLLLLLAASLLPGISLAADPPARPLSPYEPRADTTILRRQPYHAYFTLDKYGRRIDFFVSEEPSGAAPMPLVVYVHGSGCQSNFVEENGRLQGRNGHSTIADVVRGRARLVIVEKPGVKLFDAPPDPGGASRASPAFRSEHTLERWAEAVHAALETARKLPEVLPGRVLVVGHSEGGIVAAKVAAEDPSVTHVAVLAGGGPTQLFDLLTLARRGLLLQSVSKAPQERVDYALSQWREIQADPESADKLFLGHPYRRWSSFLKTSTIEQLLKTDARIYAAQGTEDQAVAWESFDLLRAELASRGRKAEFDAVAGADHSFVLHSDKPSDGWKDLFERVLSWFLRP